MQNSLYDKLKAYAQSLRLRMHMPGHKGGDGFEIDITEITGFDNLHNPNGILKDSMELAARVWGSKKSFYLVNGSTCGILAGVRALTKRGDKAIVARNCHKAVYNALELCGVESVYVMPEEVPGWNIFGSVAPENVKRLLDENKGVSLVVITSPTYEGVISDIAEISRIAHEKGARVLVDEAHGAHLGFSDCFERSSVKCGADIVIQSLHKTLACPTQTAILHINDLSLENEVKRQLSVFETSSPSYIFMAAMDEFVRKAAAEKNIFSRWSAALEDFYEKARKLQNIEILSLQTDDIDEIYAYDKSKIILRCQNTAALADRCNAEFEAVTPDFIIAMTGEGDGEATISAFMGMLIENDGKTARKADNARPFIYTRPSVYEPSFKAIERKMYFAPVQDAAGKVCAEYVWEYPPGIPLIVPGEVISQSFCDNIKNGVYKNISSDSAALPKLIEVYEKI